MVSPSDAPPDVGLDGLSGSDLFVRTNNGTGLTFDDLILLPGHIDFSVDQVSLETKVTRNLSLKLPLISSPMDTVTEHKLAISMALHGGLGIIHYNMSIADQAKEVHLVKTFKNGFITAPYCLGPDATLSDVDRIKHDHGFAGVPITANGSVGSKLLGIVANRDIDFIEDRSLCVSKVMSRDLVTAMEGVSLTDANKILKSAKKGKLPIVNDAYELVALISRRDLVKNRDFPLASKDDNKQLLVGGAIGTRPKDKARCTALVAEGVDVIVIDSSQGDSMYQVEMIQWIKATYPTLQVIGGNIVTASQAKRLIHAGVDGLKVGMGVGSICTTQEVCAVGRAQASAIYAVSSYASQFGIPVIGDGGIGSSGHIVKALCVGASVAMCGSLFAGTEEAPGQFYFQDGIRLKKYRGMGSIEAMTQGSDERYFAVQSTVKVAQGVSGSVVDKGSMAKFLPYLQQGLRHGLQDLGCKSLATLHTSLKAGTLRFERRSPAAQREGGVHGLYSYEKRQF